MGKLDTRPLDREPGKYRLVAPLAIPPKPVNLANDRPHEPESDESLEGGCAPLNGDICGKPARRPEDGELSDDHRAIGPDGGVELSQRQSRTIPMLSATGEERVCGLND